MGTEFRQSRGIMRIEAEILPQSVRYRERDWFRSYETSIPFAEISDQVTRTFEVSRLYIAITLFFGFLFLYRLYDFVSSGAVSTGSLAVAAGWFAIAAFGTWMRSARYVGFHATGRGLFFFESTGRDDPTAFLKELQEARAKYFSEFFEGEAERTDDVPDSIH